MGSSSLIFGVNIKNIWVATTQLGFEKLPIDHLVREITNKIGFDPMIPWMFFLHPATLKHCCSNKGAVGMSTRRLAPHTLEKTGPESVGGREVPFQATWS